MPAITLPRAPRGLRLRRGAPLLAAAAALLVATCKLDKLITPPSSGLLSVTPLTLSDSAPLGSSAPRTQPIAIANTANGRLDWTAATTQSSPWLTLSAPRGTAPDTLTITLDPTGLAAADYRDTVLVTSTGSSAGQLRVPVLFRVQPCGIIPITIGTPATGALSAAACAAPHRPGHAAQLFSFSGAAGDSITIEMSSAALNAYVILDSVTTAPAFAENNDCLGAGTDACLPYQRLLRSGTFVIEATSAAPGSYGAFALFLTRPRAPAAPDTLGQLLSDSATALATGGTTTEAAVVLRGVLSDPDRGDSLRLEAEVKPLSAAFTGTATVLGAPVANGQGGLVRVPVADDSSYHWRARAVDQTGRSGPWTAFGGNAEGATDFRVAIPQPPNAIGPAGQFAKDSVTLIATGGTADTSVVVLKAIVSDPDPGDQLRLQVEVRPTSTPFGTNTPTDSSAVVANGATGVVRVSGLSDGVGYHWRARVTDQTGRAGPWTSFGGNSEATADFSVKVAHPPASPTTLGQFKLDAVTAIATGGTSTSSGVVFKGTVTDPDAGDQLRLEVEIRPVGQAFQNAGATSAPASSGALVQVTSPTLSDNVGYHWQARTVDQTGRASNWVSFGGNAESANDVFVALTPQQLAFTVQPSDAVAGDTIRPPVRVAAQDTLGNTLASYHDSITIALDSNPGGATLTGTRKVAAVAGVAVFPDLILNKASTGYRLRGSITAPVLSQTSTLFDVTAGAVSPTLSTVGAAPGTITASSGAATTTITVTARDGNGNPVPGVTVVLSATGTGNTITQPGAPTNSNGVATGSLSSTKAQTKTVSATLNGLAATQTASVTVTPAAASQLFFTVQPSNASAGVAISPAVQVTARDPFGNTATGFTDSVTLAIGTNPGSGTLSGTKKVAAVAGVATFSTLSIDKNGIGYTLTAAAAGLGGANSAPFTIAPSLATKLAFTTQPSATTAGAAIAPAITVAAQDGSGNTDPNFTGQVTISIGSNPGGSTLGGTATRNAVAGVATFNDLSLDKSGSGYTVAAASGSLTGATSTAFDIRPGAATHVAFTTQPVSTNAGATLAAVQVSAQDALGNTDTSYAGQITVTLGTNPGGSTLSGTNALPATAGVATFSTLSLDKAGVGYALSATGAALAGTATSASFNITSAAVSAAQSTVSATSPITASSGASQSTITVTARDQFGNPIGGASVVLAATGSGNTLTQPLGATDVNGVATGTLSSTAAEAKTIQATVSGVVVTQTATVTVSPAPVSAAQSTVGATSPITAGGGTAAITVTAKDLFGNVIPGATVVLAATGTGNTLTQPAGPTNASGVATGTLTSTVAETKTVSATIDAVAITQTATVVVNPGAVSAAQSTVSATSPITAGSGSSTVTVTARDANGNPVAGATVVLAATGTGNTLTQPAGTTNASGVATGSLTSTVAETKTVSATIGGTAITQTASVMVNAAAATKLAFAVQPTSATAGVSISPAVQVEVEDQFGNRVRTATNPIGLAFGANPGGGTLTGGGAIAAVNGVATFSGLSINKVGTAYTLAATTTGLTSATSSAFNITFAPAAKLGFVVQPSNVAAGASIAPPVQVDVEDQFGNRVTTATTSITMAIAANPGSGTLAGTNPVSAVAGVATFSNLSINKAGTGYTLSANGGALTAATSSAFNITSSAATKLVITTEPAATDSSGLPIPTQPVVQLRDVSDNNVATSGVVITAAIAVGPGGGALISATATTNAIGAATFSGLAISGTVGSYRLQMSSGALTPDTTVAIALTSGRAAKLALSTQPSPSVQNAIAFPQQPVAQIQDAQGNVVSQSGTTVTAAIATGGGALGGTVTSLSNAGGAAAFTNLAITGATGARTLSFSATGLTAATSNTVTVTAGTATQIAVNAGNNQAATAGTAVVTKPSVIVRDVSGNPVTGVAVTFAVPGTSNGALTGPSQTTDGSGIATVGSWTLSSVAKPDTMTATSTGLTGSPVTFVDTAKVGAPATWIKFSGDNLTGQVNATLATPHDVLISDINGNPVPGVTVNWAAVGGGSVSAATSVTNATGHATITRTLGPVAGPQSTTANAASLSPLSFSITAQAGGATQMVYADSSVRRDTVGQTIPVPLAVKVMDASNNPVSGITISWSVLDGGGSVGAASSVTNASGIASVSWTLGTAMSPTDSTQLVQATGVASPLTFTAFTSPGPVSAAQTSVTASSPITASSGTSQSTITVTARDQFGNVIKGKTVVLAATGTSNTVTQPAAATDANGVATGALSSTKAETKTVSATVGGVAITQQPTVTVNPAAATNLNVVTQPSSAVAGVAITPAVQVEIRDQFNNRVTTATNGVNLAIGTNPNGGTLTGGGTTAAVSGIATFSGLSIDKVGVGYTLAAASTGLSGTTSNAFNITASTVSAAQSTVSATTPITAGGTASTLTVTAKDQFGNPVAGATVTLAATGTGNTVTQPVGTTNAGGVATGSVGSTVAESKTVSATINAVAITQTATVVVNAAAVSAAQSTVSATSPITASSGASQSTVTVTAKDQFGNPIAGATVVLAATGTGNTLTQPVGTTNASGVATGTLSSTAAAVKTVSATINAVAITQTAAVTVNPGAVAAAQSTVSATSPVTAGGAGSTITVTAKDQFGNLIQGATVVLAATGTGNTLTQPAGTTNASGVATGTLTSTVAETKTVSATINAVAITQTAAVVVNAGAVSAAQSTVSATSPITAGSGSSTITVTAKDANGNPIAGATVVLAATGTGNTLTQPAGTTNAGGVATGTLSSTAAATKTVSATINAVAITQTAAVVVNAGAISAAQSTVAATSPITASTGASQSTITVTAKDAFGNPIAGGTVTLAATGTGNTLTQPVGTTNAAGVATGTLSSTVAEAKTVSVSISSVAVTQTAAVTVNPAAASNLNVVVQPSSAIAGGAITPAVQIEVRDQFNNRVTTAANPVALAILANPGSGTLTGGGAVVPASGVATFSALSIDKVGTGYTLSATSTGLTSATTTAFNISPAGVSAAQSTVAATSPITASTGASQSTITVTAKDAFGNAIAGATVVLAAAGTGNTLTQPAGTTNAGGVATGTLSSTVAESKTVSATISGVGITQTAAVVVNAGAVTAAQSTVSATSPITASSGASQSTITVTAKDALGNPVAGATVVLAATGTGNTLTQPVGTTNASGVATGTLSSTVVESKTVSATINAVAITQTATVVVNAAAASKLAFIVQPTSATAGASITPAVQVELEDQFGNRVTATNAIGLAFGNNAGGGTLTGGTPIAAVNGVATFSGLSIDKAGTAYTLAASSTGLTGATSTAFNIAAGAVSASQSTVSATSPITAGGAASTITVTAKDAFGNPVAGATVTLAATGGANTLTQPVGTTTAGGVATGTLSSTLAESKTVSATINAVAITQTATVVVNATAVSAAQSTVAATSPITASSGASQSTVTVTAKDQFGNAVAGATVTLAATGTGNTVTQPVGTTNASGVATGTLSSTVAESKTVSATVSAVAITQTATVVVNAAALSAAQSTVAATSPISASSGASQSTVTVTAKDAFGNPIAGATVVLAATGTGNTVTQPVGTTNAAGVATGTLSSTVAESKTVSATINAVSVTQTATVVVNAGAAAQLSFTRQPTSATAGTNITPPPQVTALDAFGNVATGFTGNVTLAIGTNPGGGTLSGTATVAATNGVASFGGLSIDKSGAGYTLVASATGPASGTSAGFNITAAAASKLGFAVQPTSAAAGAAITPAVQVDVEDQFGNRITTATTSIGLAFANNAGGGTLSGGAAVAAVGGVATFSALSIDKTGTAYTLSATGGGLTAATSTAFNITAAAVSATQSTVAATSPITAGSGTSTVTVTAKDQFGNLIPGATVVLAATGTGNTVTQPAGTTNGSGVAAGSVSSTVAESKTVSATINAVAITQTATVVVNAAAVSAAQSTVSATSPITAGGAASTVTVTAKDQFGNPIAGATVSIAATGTGNTVTQPVGTTNAGGVATGSVASTIAESKVVSATINSIAITQTDTVVVNAGAVSTTTSTVAATSPITAGSGTSTVTVTAKDASGNPVAGATVTIAATGTGNTVTQPVGTTNASGVATGSVSSTVAESKTVSATINAVAITQTATVVVNAAAVSATQSTVAATSPITAGGTASTVTVTARDQFGNPIAGATVTLAATGTGNTVTQPVGTTNASGVATGSVSSTVAESKTVSATINAVGITQTATVVVNAAAVSAAQSTVSATSPITAGGTASTVTVTAKDQFGNLIQGATVVLASTGSGNTVTQPVGTTSGSGVATGSVSSTVAESKTVSATINGTAITQTATLVVNAAAVSAAQSTVAATSPITAGGGTSTVTVTAKDQFGNPVAGATVTLAATGTGNTLTQPVGTTNASGVTTGTLASTVAESKTVSATINAVAITPTATVVVNPGPVSATQSTVAATSPITTDGSASTITVTAKDQFGNVIPGATVVLAATGTGNTVTQPAGTTNGSGVATGSLTSTVVESKTVSATINAVAITQTATVVVNTGAVSASVSTVTASSGQILASSGASNVTVTVTAKDAHGNPIAGATVVLAATGSGNTLTQPSGTTNGSGVATGTFSSTVAEAKTISATINGTGIVQTAAVTVLPAGASAAQSTVGAAPGTITASSGSSASTITVTVKDQFGNAVSGTTVTLSATGSGNTVTQPVGTTNGAGQITGTVSSTAAGTKVVTATVAGAIVVTQTASVVVTAAAATHLAFTTQPTTTTAGQAITPAVVVAALDAFGNTATGFVSGVTVAISAGTGTAGATLSGTATVTAAAGVASFSTLSIDSAGTGYTLAATAGGLTGATSTAFAIVPGAVAQLVWVQQPPAATLAGTAMSPNPSVRALDAIGNLVTGFTGTVTMAIVNDGALLPPAVLSGNSVSAVGGVATFTNLQIDRTGTGYTIRASTGGVNSPVSAAFNIL